MIKTRRIDCQCTRTWSRYVHHHLNCTCGEYCTVTVELNRKLTRLEVEHDAGRHR